jgi:hypothetical protein
MMASYLILTPPEAAGGNLEKTRFIRDGFSFPAFLFPVLWLLFHRLWFYAIVAFLIQMIGFQLLSMQGLGPAGAAIIFAVHFLTAFEGRHLVFSSLSSRGWRPEGLLSAGDLATAEDIYFSDMEPAEKEDIPAVKWDMPPSSGSQSRGNAFGLPGYDGGR